MMMMMMMMMKWAYRVCKGLTSHSTLYRSFRGWFLQVRWPNQQRQRAEGSQLATKIGFNATRTTPPSYNMNCTVATSSRLITVERSQCDENPICWTYKMPRTSCNKSIALYYSDYSSCVNSRPSSLTGCGVLSDHCWVLFSKKRHR